MDNISDYILPIALAIIWIVGKFFGPKEEEDFLPPPSGQGQPPVNRNQGDIQEEIRRKIAERQQQQQQSAPARRTPPPLPTQAPPRVEEPIFEQQAPSYEEQLAAQQARLFAAQAEAQRVRKGILAKQQKAAKVAKRSPKQKPLLTPGCPTRQYVIDSVQDPEAARKAFVLQQVIGPPVAFRSEGELAANWQQK